MVTAHVDRTPRTDPRRRPVERLGRLTRWVMAASALGLIGLLGVARRLEPDPRGFGTHTQLGLAPCAFRTVTGRPCPSCGMTTSFAWTTRLRPDRAWRANPTGSLLAPACALLAPWLAVGAIRGRPWGSRTVDGPVTALVLVAIGVTLATWTFRLIPWRVT